MSVVSSVTLITALGEREGWETVQTWLRAERLSHWAAAAPLPAWGALLVLQHRERELHDLIELARKHVSGHLAENLRETKLGYHLARLSGGNKAPQVTHGIGAYNGFSGVQDAFIEVVRDAPWFFRGRVVLTIQPENGAPFVERLTGGHG